MNTEEKANELYPNNKTFCGGVAQIARDAFSKGARMQKEVDDKELSEKVSAAYQLGLSDREKQMMAGAVEGEVCGRVYDHINVRFSDGVCKFLEPKNISHIPADVSKYKVGEKVKIIIIKEEKNGTE